MRFAVNVERLVKHYRVATDTDTRDRILGDAMEVLVQSHRVPAAELYLEQGGVLHLQGGVQMFPIGRLIKLAALAAACTVGFFIVQYLAFVFYLTITYR